MLWKGSATLLGILALAALALPGLTGHYYQAELRSQLKEVESMGPGWRVKIADLQRGWFTDTATTYWTLAPDSNGPSVRIPVHHTIHHGPTVGTLSLIRIESRIELPGRLKALQERIFGGEPPIRATYRIDITGTHHLRAHIQGFDRPRLRRGRVPVEWSGVDVRAHTGEGWDRFDYRLAMDRLRVTEGRLRLYLEDMSGEGRAERQGDMLWTGYSSGGLKRLETRFLGDYAVRSTRMILEDLTSSSRSGTRRGTFFATSHLKAPTLHLGRSELGPLRLSLTSRDLPVAFLSKLRTLRSQGPVASEAKARERLRTLPFGELARSGASAEADLRLAGADGALEAGGRLHLADPGSGTVTAERLPSLLRIKAHLTLPKTLARTLSHYAALLRARRFTVDSSTLDAEDAQRLAKRMSQHRLERLGRVGWLRDEGDAYTAELRWDGERFTVNGAPLPESGLAPRTGPG